MLMVCMMLCVKQKTAYEMRISDWSSECALPILALRPDDGRQHRRPRPWRAAWGRGGPTRRRARQPRAAQLLARPGIRGGHAGWPLPGARRLRHPRHGWNTEESPVGEEGVRTWR